MNAFDLDALIRDAQDRIIALRHELAPLETTARFAHRALALKLQRPGLDRG
jgi:hypothetical protein